MRHVLNRVSLAIGLFLLVLPLAGAGAEISHQLVRIALDSGSQQAVSGRLLLFAMPADVASKRAHDGKITNVDASPMRPTLTTVAAQEVSRLAPGESIQIDADAMAFPQGFSELAPGRYAMQAVLDTDHDYAYSGRGAGDLLSDVSMIDVKPGMAMPSLVLSTVVSPRFKDWQLPVNMPAAAREKMQPRLDDTKRHSDEIDFVSPALTAFWGRPIKMRGWVITPPGYAKNTDKHYPVVYYTHGFGGNQKSLEFSALTIWQQMKAGTMPPMIWVLLDESFPTGTHEFADSVNNGPWGTALTEQLIPHLESQYRMDGKSSGRFLQGHSSGGWATLWLQVRYPKVFGGTWSTSPDPSDFHDFTGINLYADRANVYRGSDGHASPLVRSDGKVLATVEQFARLERVMGNYGGQLASFEWVFSPRGADGRPQPMFDRDTGSVDPEVVNYWREHYDIAHLIRTQWPQLKADLDGKVHVYTGTADTFYLDGAAHRLKAAFDKVGGKAEFRFMPGKTHFDLYAKGKQRHWLLTQIAWAMYHRARPQASIPTQYQALEKADATP